MGPTPGIHTRKKENPGPEDFVAMTYIYVNLSSLACTVGFSGIRTRNPSTMSSSQSL